MALPQTGTRMRAYIGAKIILATPMSKARFDREYKNTEIERGTDVEDGYHVRYGNPDGSYYDSWSPKSVFEDAYRPVTGYEKRFID